MINGRPEGAVHLTNSVVDVASLERQVGAHVVRVSCLRTTWREELAAALQQATGERSGDAAIAHIRTMRSPNHWTSLFIAGVAPRADVFLAYVTGVLCQIGAVFVSIYAVLGLTPREGVTWWLAKRPWVADWVRRGARSVGAHVEPEIAQVLLPDMDDVTACGFAAALQGLFLSALLFAAATRLCRFPPPCEAAAWCTHTNRPAPVVLFIEYHATSEELDDMDEFILCLQFLQRVPLTTIVWHDLSEAFTPTRW
jgi:hypothetical protein